MREKLQQKGVGTEITIVGQFQKSGGNQTLLLTNIYDAKTDEYLCDHLWMSRGGHSGQLILRKPNDFIICSGTICEYKKYCNLIDYNIHNIDRLRLIRPLFYENQIVYLPCERIEKLYGRYRSRLHYWRYTHGAGFMPIEVCKWDYSKIEHLFCGDEEEKGYQVIDETDQTYTMHYVGKNRKGHDEYSTIIVYKSLDDIKAEIDTMLFPSYEWYLY